MPNLPRSIVVLAATAALVSLASCRGNPLAVDPIPALTASRGGDAAPAPAEAASTGAPRVGSIAAVYTDRALYFTVFYERDQIGNLPPFDPNHAGGWCFQLFLNTDQSPTGYASGLDYLVRAIEVLPDGEVYVRRTEGGGGPGGWGEAVGTVRLFLMRDRFSVIVPLSMLGPDDGKLDYLLELYTTVALDPAYGGGVVQEFDSNFRGTTRPFGHGPAGAPEHGTGPVAVRAMHAGQGLTLDWR